MSNAMVLTEDPEEQTASYRYNYLLDIHRDLRPVSRCNRVRLDTYVWKRANAFSYVRICSKKTVQFRREEFNWTPKRRIIKRYFNVEPKQSGLNQSYWIFVPEQS